MPALRSFGSVLPRSVLPALRNLYFEFWGCVFCQRRSIRAERGERSGAQLPVTMVIPTTSVHKVFIHRDCATAAEIPTIFEVTIDFYIENWV